MSKPEAVNEVIAEAITMTDALEEVTAAKLARAQVILIAQLIQEVRQLRQELRQKTASSSFTAEDVARIIGSEMSLDQATCARIAELAKDAKRLERALARVREAEGVQNPVGLLIRILQKWSS